MADAERNDPGSPLPARGQTPLVALVLLVATAMGVLNLSSRPGSGTSADPPRAAVTGALPSPVPKATPEDALEALEPLLRFLNPASVPRSLDELAGKLDGYRVTTLVVSISDPVDSRLGYDFDMAIEAIQRAAESEGYTLDRFRFPWLERRRRAGPGRGCPGRAARRGPAGRARHDPGPAGEPGRGAGPGPGAEARAASRGRSSSGSTGPRPGRASPRSRRTCCSCSSSARPPPGGSSRRRWRRA
ncbi:MAG: hypothetical protein U0790_26375 [Isosphaeraceae bacterium]